ncbi:hypothetical protein Halha_1968 [Halobacteroides halobius DSM 5150]|uniref:Uncharacterized protein n=1 Tax=Halobacteroides halobius (strain ATCC 35273 / DSM 5150 / MD-1) TaxID=748449 RepID=L0K9B5_HALHC|nr:hypothetical protein Halha_1968 [Halobacteroides halobius DSM 5150]
MDINFKNVIFIIGWLSFGSSVIIILLKYFTKINIPTKSMLLSVLLSFFVLYMSYLIK